MLEDNVDEKYYLSDKMMKYITSKDDKYKVNENKLVINRDIACSKTTREGNTRADTTDYICEDLPSNFKLKPVMNLYEMGLKQYNRRTGVVVDTDGSSSTLLARTQGDNNMIIDDLRIRKLTPRECFRLMGVKDEDFDKIKDNQSDSSLYHLAGDSIVCQCLMALFKMLME